MAQAITSKVSTINQLIGSVGNFFTIEVSQAYKKWTAVDVALEKVGA